MTEPNKATQAPQIIGFKQALRDFEGSMKKFGGSSGQFLFVLYGDGSIAPFLNGQINPHQLIAAAKFLMSCADEQISETEARMPQGPRILNGGG